MSSRYKASKKDWILFISITGLCAGLYAALRYLILPHFCSPQTIDFLTRSFPRHRASILASVCAFVTLVIWIGVWVGMDYWKTKK